MDARRVVTLGYEGRSLDEVLDTLAEHSVLQVVDVRLNAFSRKPGFTKKHLAAALDAVGLQYVHMPSLGCSRELRAFKRDGGDLGTYVDGYLRHLHGHAESLERLQRLLDDKPSAVLCMERRIEDCHRQVLSQRMRMGGYLVLDL